MPEILVKGFRCSRCKHAWVPRLSARPVQCPSCRSPYWDRPKRQNPTSEE